MKNKEKNPVLHSTVKLVLFAADIVLLALSLFITFWIKNDLIFSSLKDFLPVFGILFPCGIIGMALFFFIFRLYSSIWEFASVREAIRIFAASVCESILILFVYLLIKNNVGDGGRIGGFPIIFCLVFSLLILALRFSFRFIRSTRIRYNKSNPDNAPKRKRTMLIGAGQAASMVIRECNDNTDNDIDIVCIIDDNLIKHGNFLLNIPIVGGRKSIKENAEKYKVDTILFAIPSIDPVNKREIINICQETDCDLVTIPSLTQIANRVNINDIRKINVEDVLGRGAVKTDIEAIGKQMAGKTALVTGGGGSIGSELCRQLATFGLAKLVIFDIYENNAYEIEQELRRNYPELGLDVLIGSVRDERRVDEVFSQYKFDYVFHAAAHKHVPLMETSPAEAVKNNIFGTYNIARASDKYGVKRFVMISTDKAVRPTSVMGATKRICEMVIKFVNDHSDTEFVAVRFGNVLGSNGSVIPLFKKQIEAGGPVTVTDPEIIRYFMTIPEAVSLVLHAGVLAKKGEIFVLDMGEPVKIADLARKMIRLSGYRPDVDIKIKYTGLRPGEKLYEELLLDDEGGVEKTDNNLIYIGKELSFDEDKFKASLEKLKAASVNNDDEIRLLIKEIVPDYRLPDYLQK